MPHFEQLSLVKSSIFFMNERPNVALRCELRSTERIAIYQLVPLALVYQNKISDKGFRSVLFSCRLLQ